MLLACVGRAQQAPDASPTLGGGRIVLVLPFDNRTGQPNLGWIGDSFPDTLSQRLATVGFQAISRDDREFALDHLGLPVDFKPSRATAIRIARTLDAAYVVVGSYTMQQGQFAVQAEVLDVNQLHMSAPITQTNPLQQLFDNENTLAWKIARQADPNLHVALQTFLASSSGVSLSAFENYIRGTSNAPLPERIKRLQAAVQQAPDYTPALLALGKTLYANRDFDHAAQTLARVNTNDRLALEAGFYLGLARFNSGRYADSETAFAFVASRLPLPEVVNNQGVAASRQGHDAAPLFRRAATADPNEGDYHFNLAVTLYRHGAYAEAATEADTAHKLNSKDNDAVRLATAARAASPADSPGNDFNERIRRTYTEASFRQAAFQMDQLRALRVATLPPAEQAAQYVDQGKQYLAQGLLPEAEQEFENALGADPHSAAGHAGLARIREQSGDPENARKEALAAVGLKPNVDGYLVLARLEFRAANWSACNAQLNRALQLEPGNAAARALRHEVELRSTAGSGTTPQ
ncbi:MAG: tetratricopeptide repeat protein [Acidobacteriota bacterium]|nr:tetratricopeptide repeat protein [Acidobacteriota bacterium]